MGPLEKSKGKYLSVITKINDIVKGRGISKETLEQLENAKNEIAGYEILIPVCGGFNAGKSSLVNALIGTEYLPCDILPETAIATEIRRGTVNHIEAVAADKSRKKFEICDIKKLSINDYEHIEVFLNSPSLEKLGDTILVDMPGTDSSLEAHNKAIFSYLNKGAHYIFVVDAEDGTLKSSSLNFLNELKSYGKSFSVVINKTDKAPIEKIEEVKNHIESILAEMSTDTVQIGTCSAHDGKIKDFISAATVFDGEKTLSKMSGSAINEVIDSAISELNLQYNAIDMDSATLDKSIREFAKKREEAECSFAKEEKKINAQFSDSTIDQILLKVKTGIRAESMTLAGVFISSGKDAFGASLNELIRPLLINSTRIAIDDFTKAILASTETIFNNMQHVEVCTTNLGDSETLKKFSESLFKTIGDSKNSYATLVKVISDKSFNLNFKTIMGATAAITSLVAPWIELIIIFLPEIIKLLSSVFGKSEDSKLKELAAKIENELVPTIACRLRPDIEKSMTDAKEQLMNEIHKAFDGEVAKIESAMKEAQRVKSENIEKVESGKNAVKVLIEALLSIKKDIAKIAVA